MSSILILGRQPKLGLAELESLYGSPAVQPFGAGVAKLDLASDQIDFARLGGSSKLAGQLTELTTTEWRRIERELIKVVSQLNYEPGKITVGLSVFGLTVHFKEVQATALRLKKAIRAQTAQSVRVVLGDELALNSAQVLHNGLTNKQGLELIVAANNQSVVIGQTIAEQDIEAYAARDQGRPKRDARVGMLPPKLAQIIINHGVGQLAAGSTVLDPFCGTGVILQEASLMGYNSYGTDLEPRMIDFTKTNLDWLNQTHELAEIDVALSAGDATNHIWEEPFDAVACEGYLGQPFNAFPGEQKLRDVMTTCNLIMKGFLKNISQQIQPGSRLCIAMPAWRRPSGKIEHLNLLDSLEELGYNRVSFVHVDTSDLIYYREDQIVARELVTIVKK